MTTEIVAFVTAVGHATNILKTAIDARDESKRREALSELTSAMAEISARQLAVTQNQQSLLQENEALKKKIEAYDKWEQEKERYALQSVGSGGFVYALKPAHDASDPPHWLCTNCYKDRHKSILQQAGLETGDRGNYWLCPHCKGRVMSQGDWPQSLDKTA